MLGALELLHFPFVIMNSLDKSELAVFLYCWTFFSEGIGFPDTLCRFYFCKHLALEERILLVCVLNVMLLLFFFDSSSLRLVFVCSMLLRHNLVVHPYFFTFVLKAMPAIQNVSE